MMSAYKYMLMLMSKVKCACGCGQEREAFDTKGKPRKFINGHNGWGNKHNLGRKHTKETRQKVSDAGKGKKKNVGNKASEETKRKMSISHKGIKPNEETKRKLSKALIGNKRNLGNKRSKETKLKMSASAKGKKHNIGRKATEDQIQKLSGKNNHNFGKQLSKETRLKISESLKGRFNGKNNPSWKGGISFEPYCPKFDNEFKERVRAYFNHKCFLCGAPQQKRKLSVHHVNYDKMVCCNDTKPLFVPLCMTCHLKTNHNREHWEKYFTDRLMAEHDGKCYYLIDEIDIG